MFAPVATGADVGGLLRPTPMPYFLSSPGFVARTINQFDVFVKLFVNGLRAAPTSGSPSKGKDYGRKRGHRAKRSRSGFACQHFFDGLVNYPGPPRRHSLVPQIVIPSSAPMTSAAVSTSASSSIGCGSPV